MEHKGIERILGYFQGVEDAVHEAYEAMDEEMASNATSTAKE